VDGTQLGKGKTYNIEVSVTITLSALYCPWHVPTLNVWYSIYFCII